MGIKNWLCLIDLTQIDMVTYQPYLADYGLACTREQTCVGTAVVMGTAAYSSPEDFYCVYSTKSDIWALGCIFYELMAEKMIWKEVNRKPMAIQRHFFFKKGPNVSHLISSIKGVVGKCLNFDPEERPDDATIAEELAKIEL